MYSLLTALALGTSGCDREDPLAAEPRAPQAVQQSRDSALAPNADTYIRQGNPNQNQGTELILRLTASGKQRALLRWDPPAITGAIGGDSVAGARLELTIAANADNWGTSGRTIDLHRLTQAWTEAGATWNCADDTNTSNPVADCSGATAWAMDGPDPRPYNSTPTATRLITNGLRGVMTLDVTADVRGLSSGGSAQHGWIMKKTDDGASGQVEFGSRESGSAPRLVLTLESADTSRPPIPPAAYFFPSDTALFAIAPYDTVARFYRAVVGIGFDDSTSGGTVRSVLSRYQATIIAGLPNSKAYIIRVPDPGPTFQALESLLERLNGEPGVDLAFPLVFREATKLHARYPADGPGADRAAWFQSPTPTSARAWLAVRAPLAWGCETGAYGSDRVRVGVVDFLFDESHPDLLFADVIEPPDSDLGPDPNVASTNPGGRSHGTAVAGVLAATGDNGVGLAGMIWQTELYGFALGRGTLAVRDKLLYLTERILPLARDLGVRVLVISLETGITEPNKVSKLRVALQQYVDAGNLLVLAAGNAGTREPIAGLLSRRAEGVGLHQAVLGLFASSNGRNILVVAGTDDRNRLWNDAHGVPQSNFFVGGTEIAAPATDIRVLTKSGEGLTPTMDTSGTSLSAPMVAGVAAQLWAMDPTLTAAQVKDYTLRGARESRLDPQSGHPEPPKKVERAQDEIYQLDAYGALALLSRERSGLDRFRVPICGYPVLGSVSTPEGVLLARAPGDTGRIPVPGLLALTSVAQGGRQLAVVVQDASLNVRAQVIDHRGDLLATLASNVLERHFLERDTADLVRGDVVLPDGSAFPTLRVRRASGSDTTIDVFPNTPSDMQQLFMTFVAASPAGDAAATGWSGVTGAGVIMRWELVPLGAGAPTRVRDGSLPQFVPGQNYDDVPSVLLSRAAWSHDGRRVVFPILRQDLDWFGDFEWITVDGDTELLSFVQGQGAQGTVDHWAVLEPRFSPDDVVLHTREQPFNTGACRFARRSGVNPTQLLDQASVDCATFFTPPEIFPNIRLRPPAVLAAADATRARVTSPSPSRPLLRWGAWVQAN